MLFARKPKPGEVWDNKIDYDNPFDGRRYIITDVRGGFVRFRFGNRSKRVYGTDSSRSMFGFICDAKFRAASIDEVGGEQEERP